MIKQWFLILVIASLATLSEAFAQSQTFRLCIENQRVSSNGRNLEFDVVIVNTGINSIYLGSSDLHTVFNRENFTSPEYNFVLNSAFSDRGYEVIKSQVSGSGNMLSVAIEPPVFSSRSDLEENGYAVQPNGRVVLGRGFVSTVSNSNGTSGLKWQRTGLLRNTITFIDEISLEGVLVDDGLEFCPEEDIRLNPNGGNNGGGLPGDKSTLVVSPNPVRDGRVAKIVVSNAPEGQQVVINIYNSTGQLIYTPSGNFVIAGGGIYQEFLLPVELSSGNYVVELVDTQGRQIATGPLIIVK